MRSGGEKAENRELGVAEQPGCKVLAGRSPGCELDYRGVGTSPMSRVPRGIGKTRFLPEVVSTVNGWGHDVARAEASELIATA